MMNLGTSNALVALAESCLLHGWKVCLHLLFRTIDMLFFMKWEWPFKKKFLGKMMLYFFHIGTFSLHCFIFFLRKPHCDSLFHCFVPTVNQTVRLRAETWRVQSLSTTFCYILLILKPTASSGSSQNDPQVWSIRATPLQLSWLLAIKICFLVHPFRTRNYQLSFDIGSLWSRVRVVYYLITRLHYYLG